jgi:hypothetical protein
LEGGELIVHIHNLVCQPPQSWGLTLLWVRLRVFEVNTALEKFFFMTFNKHFIAVSFTCVLLFWGVNAVADSPQTLSELEQKMLAQIPSGKMPPVNTASYLDGVRYVYTNQDKTPLLIEDFLYVAFSLVPWPHHQVDHGISYFINSLNPSFREGKWYWASVVQDGKYPNLSGLMRWDVNSTIDIVVDGDPDNAESQKKLLSAVRAVLPDLQKKSGLKMNVVDRKGGDDLTGAIIIRDPVETRLHNKYKVWRPKNGTAFNFDKPWLRAEFTVDKRAQPSGYIFPKHDNTINFALCYVLSDLSDDMVRALTTECLLRSLGLPGTATSYPLRPIRSFLAEWNKEEGKNAKTIYLDGPRQARNVFGIKNKGNEIIPETIKDFVHENRVSDFDGLMLKALYCPALKPGMSQIEALDALANNKNCFK